MSGAAVSSTAKCGPLSWCGVGNLAPGPCLRKYLGAQVPAPSPRPRAPLGPSQRRPYGQLPSTIVCRVRGSCWGGRHRLLGPYPHRWVRGTGCGWAPRAARPLPSPVVSWVRPKCTWNEGLGDEKRGIFPGEQQPENTAALTLPKPGAADKGPRAPRLPGTASQDLWARGNPHPAGEWASR